MGTFIGHFVPGFALVLLGLWHNINTIRSFCLKGSHDSFTIRYWYPFPKFKYLELISISVFSLLAISTQLLDFPSFKSMFKLDSFEHATMFLHLAIYSTFTLSSELTRSSDIFTGVTGMLAASVFGQELFLLHFHSADHVGLEGHYHWLLQLIVSVSFVSSIISTIIPKSFPSSLVLSVSVLFQGCWLLNMGFILWIPKYVPKGCTSMMDASVQGGFHSAVACESPAADMRARALANLQFSWILCGILVFTASVCLKLSGKFLSTCQSREYEQLRGRGGDASAAMDGFAKSDP